MWRSFYYDGTASAVYKNVNYLPNITQYNRILENGANVQVPSHNKDIVFSLNINEARQGAFSVVYPCWIDGRKYAMRCWKCISIEMLARIRRRLSIILSFQFGPCQRYIIPFSFIEDGIYVDGEFVPYILMDWMEDLDLKSYLCIHRFERDKLENLAIRFKEMTRLLWQEDISHNDLQPQNIRVRENGEIYLIDYDTLYLPGMLDELDEVKGEPLYQHPLRNKNRYLSPILDRYATIIIYASIIGVARFPFLGDRMKVNDGKELLFSNDFFSSEDILAILSQDKELKELSHHILGMRQIASLEEILPLHVL